MAKFPVTFGKRKSATSNADSDGQVSSFRVLERTEVAGVKSFDGGSGLGRPIATTVRPYSQVNMVADEDNMFANLQINRASGSSNTTKTASTDTSSRHSAASTTPSSATPSADPNHAQILDDARIARKPLPADSAPPQGSKSGSGFLNRAGRTFSFGSKKTLPLVPDDTPPPVPTHSSFPRPRGMTSTSIATDTTTSTATPPKLDEDEFNLDLGGDFGKMFNGFDKRASVATIRNGPPQSLQSLQPRSLTDNRPSPSTQSNSMRPPPSPHSVNSDHSSDGLLLSSNAERPSLFSRHTGTPVQKLNRPADILEDENAMLLKESLAASKFLTAPGARATQTSRARQDDERINSPAWKADHGGNEDNLFDNNLLHSTRVAHRYVSRPPSPPRNRVMTPAQFEQYKQEKERTSGTKANVEGEAKDDEDEENYEDDEDDIERSRQAAKQRKKQEAHMTVYRQQMMKVTGESANPLPRPPLATSATAPVLVTASDGSDEDEEIPLAILAAHGFPNKNRPPARLNNAVSNPNIRSSMMAGGGQPSRPLADNGSASSGVTAGRSSQLPAFARNLPQDPFVGAGLVRNAPRESMALAGGAPAPASQPTLPPGGLVGVIANEERSRALRRGSPNVDSKLINGVNGAPVGFDPIAGIPHQMMYGMGGSPSMPHLAPMGYPQPMLTPGDQAQLQMNQQMQQFMQMQMQFMQMMAANQGGPGPRPNSFVVPTGPNDMLSSRHSFIGGDFGMDPPRLADHRMRTMSMVQPSSASWIQPVGYAPSIRVQGDGYAPSIAPSERSNIGLPGRYRPVSQAPHDAMRRVSTMSGALSSWNEPRNSTPAPTSLPKSGSNSDDDDEEGWVAMKAKREKKRSLWKSKKGLGGLSALIS